MAARHEYADYWLFGAPFAECRERSLSRRLRRGSTRELAPMVELHLDIADLVDKCRAALLEATPHAIPYIDVTDLRRNSLPLDLVASPINVYALWARAKGAGWELKYIGQRSSKKGWQRVGEHLFWKHPKTQSKLDNVLQSLLAGQELGVTGILVSPDSLRLAVEAELIRTTSGAGVLDWNKKGKSPDKGPKSSVRKFPSTPRTGRSCL